MKQYGPWKIVDSSRVYQDPWVGVQKDNVIRPDGAPGTYTVVEIKPGVSVLAVDDDRCCYLTKEFHYAVGRVTIETASGGIESDEDALLAAKRELQEELGVTAESWTDLGRCDPFTANVLSPTTLYLARDLTIGETNPEGTELIECVKLPLDEVVQMVMHSEITHTPSCVLILKAAAVLAG